MSRLFKGCGLALLGVGLLVGVECYITSIDTSNWNAAVQTFVGTLLPVILASCVIIGIFQYWNDDSTVKKYIRYKKWSSFGNRLKVAYEAKFGYSNPAFNQEIDHHVKAMRSLGKGYTKSINYDRLKALAKFVEVPFAIPEEERLIEEDKTRLFGGIN